MIDISGACSLGQAKKIYSGNKWYHYKRIQRLVEAGYLIKRSGYVELTSKGAEMIGSKKLRFNKEMGVSSRFEIANIALALKNHSILSSREVREEYNLYRKTLFKNVLVCNNLYYFIYLLPEDPAAVLINSIKSELKSFSSSIMARHSIVFAPTLSAMAKFGIADCKQNELLLLPYPSGLDLINTYLGKALDLPRVNKPFADYETEDYCIAVLTLNNIARRYALNAYFAVGSDKPVKILCLSSQVEIFSNIYPSAKLEIVDTPTGNYQGDYMYQSKTTYSSL